MVPPFCSQAGRTLTTLNCGDGFTTVDTVAVAVQPDEPVTVTV